MKKITAIFFSLVFVLAMTRCDEINWGFGGGADKKVWVAIIVDDGGSVAVEYYGQVSENTLHRLYNSKDDSHEFFRIENVGWPDNDEAEANTYWTWLEKVNDKNGRPYGYTSTAYFSFGSVLRVVEIDPNVAQKNLLRF